MNSTDSRRPEVQPGAPRARAWLLFLGVAAASVLFRLPALLNAAGVHSDAAIIGLQAMHLLKGEWSWFIWGAGYQASLDAVLVALGFAVTGPTPLTLMAVPLAGHLLLTFFTWDVLRKRLSPGLASIASLCLAFAPQAINGVALYAPRQWCLTSLFAGVWLLDSAPGAKRPALRLGAGALVGMLSLYLDLYALQLMPALGALALACAFDGRLTARDALRRLGGLAAGAGVALLVLWLSRQSPVANAVKATLTLDRARPNFDLLWNTCLPWLLGYGVYVPGGSLYPQPWTAPAAFHAVQVLGAALLLLGILAGGLSVFSRRLPWPVRRLGGFGFLAATAALGGFLVSTMPADMWSARYLAPIVWTAPLALAPVAYRLRERWLGVALGPYLVAAAVGGWLSYGPYVNGPWPVRTPRGTAGDELAVADVLRARNIHQGAAQYWLSYRLTFLWREDPILVPFDGGEDRYAPYRRAFEAAPDVAYVFHPSEPRARPEAVEQALRQGEQSYERLEVRGFTVLIHHRRR